MKGWDAVDDDAVVAGVCYNKATVGEDGYVVRKDELVLTTAVGAEF